MKKVYSFYGCLLVAVSLCAISACASSPSSNVSSLMVSQAKSIAKTNSVSAAISFLNANLSKPSLDATGQFDALRSLSSLYSAKGNYIQGEIQARRALKLEPKNAGANLALANALLGRGELAQAMPYAQTAFDNSRKGELRNSAILLREIIAVKKGASISSQGAKSAEQKILAGLSLIKSGDEKTGSSLVKTGLLKSKLPSAQSSRYTAMVVASGLVPSMKNFPSAKQLIL